MKANMPASGELRGVRFDTAVRYNDRQDNPVTGDTWSCAWTPSGEVFSIFDDTAGFGLDLKSSGNRNVALAGFGTTRPPDLRGHTVNGMEEFGAANQLGRDGACWKGNGMTSVDGVLYMSVSRHWYHVKAYDHRQISRDASIIASTDGGRTFSPTPYHAEPLPNPLFPGPNFATPFFLDAGQDGSLGPDAPETVRTSVYAVSSDGYWDNGNALHLGRVRRDRLAEMKLDDWEFFCGTLGSSDEPVWASGRPGLDACYPILSRPFCFGQTGMLYLEAIKRYVVIGWHYPGLDRNERNHHWSQWDFFTAPNPWGPWRLFHTHHWRKEGYYNPVMPSAYLNADGLSGWILACGDFMTHSAPVESTLYTLWLIPLTFEVEA